MSRRETESWAEDTARDVLRIDADLEQEDLEALPKEIWDDLVGVLESLEGWIVEREREREQEATND